MPIIIETPAPPTRERLVLVSPSSVSNPIETPNGEVFTVRTTEARDATPDDLARAGYVTGEMLAEQVRIVWAASKDAISRAEKAERALAALRDQVAAGGCEAAHLGERTYECDIAQPCGLCRLRARSEKAERLHSEAEAQIACRNELRAQLATAERERDTLRAELAALRAPVEGEPTDNDLRDVWDAGETLSDSRRALWRAGERAGVAHERARHARTEPRATDEELLAIADAVYEEAHGGEILNGPHEIARRVAAHVRAEMCLVTRAVGMEADVSLDRHPRGLGERAYTIRVQCPTKPSAIAADVPASEVPARVARLLGEVER